MWLRVDSLLLWLRLASSPRLRWSECWTTQWGLQSRLPLRCTVAGQRGAARHGLALPQGLGHGTIVHRDLWLTPERILLLLLLHTMLRLARLDDWVRP